MKDERIPLIYKLRQLWCKVKTGHFGTLTPAGTYFICQGCSKIVWL